MAITKEVRQCTVDRDGSVMAMLAAVGGHQQVSQDVVATMPVGLVVGATELIVAQPKLDRYAEGQVTAGQVAQLYAENGIFPDPRALLSAILTNPSMCDGRHYAVQWRVGEDYAFLSACFYKDEWYIHAGSSRTCWSESWGEEWHFVGTPPLKMDRLF